MYIYVCVYIYDFTRERENQYLAEHWIAMFHQATYNCYSFGSLYPGQLNRIYILKRCFHSGNVVPISRLIPFGFLFFIPYITVLHLLLARNFPIVSNRVSLDLFTRKEEAQKLTVDRLFHAETLGEDFVQQSRLRFN